MKILFTVSLPNAGIAQIQSNLRWINGTLLTDMTDNHIRNARLWIYRQLQGYKELGYKEEKYQGASNEKFLLSHWNIILEREELRRKDEIQLRTSRGYIKTRYLNVQLEESGLDYYDMMENVNKHF